MKYILILIILALLILCGIYVYIESTALSVVRYTIASDKLKLSEYDIVMLSDLHETVHGKDNEEVLSIIDGIGPDAVFFAGDMITASENHPLNYEKTLSLIRRIAKKYPIYYGIGNHEEKLKRPPYKNIDNWNYYTGELQKSGIHILQNEIVRIEEAGITVYGLDLEYQYYRRLRERKIPEGLLKDIFGEADRDSFSILIAHFPDQFESYAAWEPDLVLSGHVHGGIIRVPFLGGLISPQLKLFPKYDSGEFMIGKTRMIISRGTGSHSVPIRINNRAEITHIRLIAETV
ncbi:MAG: metallophosphoesterase [Lachnospiraceae bacterium]|nr:metallophosphoesterase [Lachnospiraceae bacterium]